jgi:hypothetical protein
VDASYFVTSALIYAYDADLQTQKPQTAILDLLGQTLAGCPGLYEKDRLRWKCFLNDTVGNQSTGNVSILPLAVMYDLTAYVAEKTKRGQPASLQAQTPASLIHFMGTLEGYGDLEDRRTRTIPGPSERHFTRVRENI